MNRFEWQIDFIGGRPVDPGFKLPGLSAVDIDMWELNDGRKLLYCINNKFLVVFTHSYSMLKVARMKWHLKNFSVRFKLSELNGLPETKKRPWWLYGMS